MFNTSKYLSPAEDRAFHQIMGSERSRNTLMLSLLRAYGMRASELLALRRRDFDVEGRVILVTGLKGSYAREFPLTDDFFERLSRIARGLKGDDDLFFPISYYRLRQIWLFYRPCKKKLHSLRHTLAIEAWERSKDLQLVRQILGHKSINSTMVYQQYAYTRSEFAKVLIPLKR